MLNAIRKIFNLFVGKRSITTMETQIDSQSDRIKHTYINIYLYW
jgi:hypothetical protein